MDLDLGPWGLPFIVWKIICSCAPSRQLSEGEIAVFFEGAQCHRRRLKGIFRIGLDRHLNIWVQVKI